MAATAAATAS